MRKGSHARDDYGIHPGKARWVSHQTGRRSSGFKSLADASEVAATIINDAEFFPAHRTPFVLGMP